MPRRARPQWDKIAAPRIVEERVRRAWSQQRLAEELGVDRKTVGRWELGATSPEAAQLQTLAASGWDVQYILTGLRSEGLRAGERRVSGDEARLVDQWRGLLPEHRSALRVLLEALSRGDGRVRDGEQRYGQNSGLNALDVGLDSQTDLPTKKP